MNPRMHTLLVLDPQPTSLASKILDGSDALVVRVKDPVRAMHALSTMEVAVFVCDLGTPGVNFERLRDVAKAADSLAQVVLTGGAAFQAAAQEILRKQHATAFVARPWRPAEVRAAVANARAQHDAQRQASKPRRAASGRRRAQGAGRDEQISTEADANRYQILEKLGEGGTGAVYRARDLLLDMDVAVKILLPALATDAEAIAAMKQEACLAMRLAHTCIVRLYNFARVGKNYFLVMELVKGRTFQSLLQDAGSFTPHAVNEVVQICSDALDYAHRHGVLHNDLKPANILLSVDNVIKIIDFGVACLVDRQRETGEIAGTPEYMSPEQIRGEMLGPQTDIYALGMIAYQLLTGRLPYPPGTKLDELRCVERLPLEGVPSTMASILQTALEDDPMARYASVSDFACAFDHAYRHDYADGGGRDPQARVIKA